MSKEATELLETVKQHMGSLQALWKGVDTDYPSDYQGLTAKSEPLIKALPLLAGSKVMDIGCNSGIYSLLAARYAHSVVGADPSPKLIKRAQLTKEYFENTVYSAHNVRFIEGNFADHIGNGGFDAVIASLVLYHLGDVNIKILSDFLAKSARKVLIQARPQRMEAFLKHPEWGRVSTTKVYNGLYKLEDCLNFIRDCGFADARVLSMNAYYYEYFPIIYAEK